MAHNRILNFENSVNLRELGGYQTKDGQMIAYHRLLRSGAIAALTPEAAAELAAYGVVTDIDLRSNSEVKSAPDVIDPAVHYHHLSVYPFADRSGFLKKVKRHLRAMTDRRMDPMAETYLKMLTDSRANQIFGQLFDLLLANTNPDEAVLFHCTAGKDRTGVAAMMILGGLGVPDQTIEDDYLLTNVVFAQPNETVEAELRIGDNEFIHRMNVQAAEQQTYLAVADLIKTDYGDWPSYLKTQLKLSDGDLADLRALYLTEDTNKPTTTMSRLERRRRLEKGRA